MGLVAKAFQDIITFSRASSGTYVNSNGYITNSSVLNYLTYSNQPENAAWTKSNSFVQQNLLTYSQEFDNAAWSKFQGGTGVVPVVTPNQGIAPDGTLTADRVVFDRGAGTTASDISYLNQTFTSVSADCTGSFWLKTFDGSTKTITIRVGNTFNYTQTVTGTWTRVSLTGTSPITRIDLLAYGDKQVQVTDLLVWGSQLVQGSVPGDYRATTSAALPCLYADYNGALRARKLCETTTTSVHLAQNNQATVGNTQTISVYAKAGERTQLYLQVGTNGGYFNLATGVVVSGTNASITPAADGWYRCALGGFPVATNANCFIGAAASGTNVYAGDGSSGIYIADAQLNDGSSALAYYNTDASAYNAPRFDYDPVTLAAKGLLVEESRANLFLRSNELTTAPWVVQANTNMTAASAQSPDGTVNAWKMYASNGLVAAGLLQGITKAASALTYAASIYAKPAGQNWLQIAVFDGTNGNRYWYNVSTGAVGTTTLIGAGLTGVSASIVPAGNGFYRCVLVATSSTVTTYSVYFYPALADGNNGSGDASGNGVYVYGADLEQGAFATSYIPTTASQVTRAADVASVNTLSPWYNSVAGTLYVEATAFAGTGGNRYYEFTDGTSANVIQAFAASATIHTEWIYVSGAPQAQLSSSGSPTSLTKIGAAYATNDFAASLNGAAPATDTSGSIPSVNKLMLGSSAAGSAQLCGHLRRITYYPRRLTNAELQTLTTL